MMRRRTVSREVARLPQLPDYLAPGLDIIFVGINPGVQSARAGHYYANPRNPFWRLLYQAGLTPRELRPEEDHLLPTLGYGLTDIVKRPSRGVADLRPPEFRRGRQVLEEKLRARQPLIVCFNGKTAGRAEPVWRAAGYATAVLPSTSPAYTRPMEEKLAAWRAVARFLEEG